jgi:ubiquitin-like modifier-activating enzyme ATG7
MQVEGKPYDCCSACSDKIINLYEADPWGFLKKALNEKGYVEEVSGLAEVQRLADQVADTLEWDDEEGPDEGEGELI